jgi:hypothetical protein
MLSIQLVDRIGWTLLHSVWQVAVIACLFALVNALLLRSEKSRYLVGCAGLLAMVVSPAVTFCLLNSLIANVASHSANRDAGVHSFDGSAVDDPGLSAIGGGHGTPNLVAVSDQRSRNPMSSRKLAATAPSGLRRC